MTGHHHAYGAAGYGHLAYLAYGDDGVLIYDMTNPAAPLSKGQVNPGGPARAVVVRGHYLFVAAYDAGVQIYDIADPIRPTTQVASVTVSRCWPVSAAGPKVSFALKGQSEQGMMEMGHRSLTVMFFGRQHN
jgi:hypothetical protein